jgi:hypothetical protein
MAELTCTQCHNATTLLAAKKAGWEVSLHGSGTAYAEEYGRNSCTGCHSGNSFIEMVAAGGNFSTLENGAADPMRQNCQTCHKIHDTYTSEDWALRTVAPVSMVTSKATFDGGQGNLCANCHQARRYLANFVDKTDATKYATTTRFNTHYSVQADVLMGAGDFGVTGKPGAHYSMVKDTCVGCHMGEGANHTNEPQIATCTKCHADAEDFNINGYLDAFETDYAALEEALLAQGLLSKGEDGTIATVPGTYDAGPAKALFFYNLVHEDGSEGIHNPTYFKALMAAALEAIQ